MSTTADLEVAMRYCVSPSSLLLKIQTSSFMERSVSLSFLSCFPEEEEYLFAPLTYLRPTGRTRQIQMDEIDGVDGESARIEKAPVGKSVKIARRSSLSPEPLKTFSSRGGSWSVTVVEVVPTFGTREAPVPFLC